MTKLYWWLFNEHVFHFTGWRLTHQIPSIALNHALLASQHAVVEQHMFDPLTLFDTRLNCTLTTFDPIIGAVD